MKKHDVGELMITILCGVFTLIMAIVLFWYLFTFNVVLGSVVLGLFIYLLIASHLMGDE